jgi:D-alanyl-D-alanine carboxypeptidase
VKERDFGTGIRPKPMKMDNHNKLLGKIAGVDGLKTGYTESAGYCISATAQREGRRIIAVVMGAFGHNRTIDKGQARDFKTMELLERGFATLPALPPAVRTNVAPVTPAANDVPAVKTNPPATAVQKASPAKEPEITFRIPPPQKKP